MAQYVPTGAQYVPTGAQYVPTGVIEVPVLPPAPANPYLMTMHGEGLTSDAELGQYARYGSIAACTYHGYKAHGGVLGGAGWGVAAAFFPIVTPLVAIIMGFGKRRPG